MNKKIILYNFLSILYNLVSTLYNFYRFSLPFILLFLEKTLFSREKKAPAGKRTHGKIFLRIFSKKRAPAGKCTHGKNIFNNLEDFNNSKGFLTILSNLNITFFSENGFFSKKKGPCRKMHTRQKYL